MTNQETIVYLKNVIKQQLSPIIGKKVLLTDLPYHGNIGDILIWEGENMFLKEIGSQVLSQTSCNTFMFPHIDEEVTICLNGGGNFGDLYRIAQDFRKKVIIRYHNNRIVIFPQSVWYEDKSLIEEDAQVFSSHPDLFICARDRTSYDFLRKHFDVNKILLVPDMAFYIGDLSKKYTPKELKNNALYIRRKDKEEVNKRFSVTAPHDTRDWPMFENNEIVLSNFFNIISSWKSKLKNFLVVQKILNTITDNIMRYYFRTKLIRNGIKIISPYKDIYTTRLHGLILGILLNKNIIAFDNYTKKVSDFSKNWLSNDNQVKVVE